MKISALHAQNFASYKTLSMSFVDGGLTLLSGPTGGGKSTIPDMIYWGLFGETSKGVNVDAIRSWASDRETSVTVYLDTVTISRKRGLKNDLCFWPVDGEVTRGKDLNDTQRLINQYLGLTAEDYANSAYLHEFSPAASFFTAKAKDRHELLESIADLSYVITLKDRADARRRLIRSTLAKVENRSIETETALNQLTSYIQGHKAHMKEWEHQQALNIKELTVKCDNFKQLEASRIASIQTKIDVWGNRRNAALNALVSKIEDLESNLVPADQTSLKCDKCGSVSKKAQQAKIAHASAISAIDGYKERIADMLEQENPYVRELERAKHDTSNPYIEQLEKEKMSKNPHSEMLDILTKKYAKAKTDDIKSKKDVASTRSSIVDLETIVELCAQVRIDLLNRSVLTLEQETNRILETYFDAVLRVDFDLIQGDILHCGLSKDGNNCDYKQLSKGQRGLLKLAFSAAVMKATADKTGVHCDLLSFDESLDGLDADLKVKAFSLFQELQARHSTVLVIDHSSELQTLFNSRYLINLENGHSEITHAT